MRKHGKIGIIITSYESKIPVLSHIFWGNTWEEAIKRAKAHLLTDYFFSSSFVGHMKWNKSFLELSVDYEADIEYDQRISSDELREFFDELETEAEKINKEQEKNNFDEVISRVKDAVRKKRTKRTNVS